MVAQCKGKVLLLFHRAAAQALAHALVFHKFASLRAMHASWFYSKPLHNRCLILQATVIVINAAMLNMARLFKNKLHTRYLHPSLMFYLILSCNYQQYALPGNQNIPGNGILLRFP